MNWGHKLLIFIICFIVAMLSMVYIASKQTNEMMDEKYYEREVQFQNQIDAQKALQLNSQEAICSQNQEAVVVHLPDSLHNALSAATLEFIRPNDEKKDVLLDLKPDENGIQNIPLPMFQRGKYLVRIKWTNGGKQYYKEENIFINK